MKIARFCYKEKIRWGKIQDDAVILLHQEPFARIKLAAQKVPLKKIKLLPLKKLKKILALWRKFALI